ncbi:MAG: cyclic peptide export ABC transporter [Xanthobacteraceae bacterium]
MTFLQLARREMHGSLPRLIFMSGLGGISNATILAAVNAGAQAAGNGEVSVWSAGLFVIALLLFIKTQHYILIASTVEIEAIIHKVRLRLMDQVRRSELLPLDEIGRSQIVSAITKETGALLQAANMLAFAGQGAVLVVFIGMYIAYLSFAAFLLSVLILGIVAVLFHAKSDQLTKGNKEAGERENRLYDRLTDLLDGFKEVRMNQARSDDLFDDTVEVSRVATNIKIRTQSESFRRLVFTQASVYLLLGGVVFVVPALSDTTGSAVTQTTTALMFVVGVCLGLIQTIPVVSAADTAADNIANLEQRLQSTIPVLEAANVEPRRTFQRIEMRNVEFRYVAKTSDAVFQVGPVDFSLRLGDLVFITGGNGSGKSTFLKVLAGLYEPDSGEITVDGMRVNDRRRESYRSLITAIFADYHLFQRLYGIRDPDLDEIDRLLEQFKLDTKTSLTNGEFRTIELSSGQRRRLALIVALLEKRPILLLDEWAADQDPEFRRKFYHEMLPTLHRNGATIVVVTHDDRYLEEMEYQGRRLRMDEGRFVEGKPVESEA